MAKCQCFQKPTATMMMRPGLNNKVVWLGGYQGGYVQFMFYGMRHTNLIQGRTIFNLEEMLFFGVPDLISTMGCHISTLVLDEGVRSSFLA